MNANRDNLPEKNIPEARGEGMKTRKQNPSASLAMRFFLVNMKNEKKKEKTPATPFIDLW